MAKSNFAKRLLVSTSLIGGAVMAQAVAPAMAQLDQIVVTAQSRAKGLQDTPISITALPAEKLAETGIQKAEDLQFLVPNFTMTETVLRPIFSFAVSAPVLTRHLNNPLQPILTAFIIRARSKPGRRS